MERDFGPTIVCTSPSGRYLSIPLSQSRTQDLRFWIFDAKGNYSVKDGYKAEIGFFDSPQSSSALISTKWWQFIWVLSIPPKVRIFWWRVLNNMIPTEANLRAHHVPVIGFCPLCHFHNDSTTHALFFCLMVKSSWKITEFWHLLKQERNLDTWDLIHLMRANLKTLQFEMFAVCSWAIWTERNRLLHDKDSRTDAAAAYIDNTNEFAIGGVIRNHEGQPILVFGRRIRKLTSILYAKLEAIYVGLIISGDNNLQIHLISSDSLLAVQSVTCSEGNWSYADTIVERLNIYLVQLVLVILFLLEDLLIQ
ncbi:uncharacterized protein [Henckelia pumila]|uniref:uncharacterized protein n=1 Tax=Henckelia pumila TaxID=405737 RepID=UPI003C6DF3D4